MTIRRLDRLGYSEIVCDFLSEVRGKGLMLSPVELELVASWEAEGIPVEVVCRGLLMGRQSHERAHPGVRPPHRLSYYAGAVRDAWRAHREQAVGRHEEEEEG